jgi:hypothetical protein
MKGGFFYALYKPAVAKAMAGEVRVSRCKV